MENRPGNEEPTLVNTEWDAGQVEDDGVVDDEVSYASISKETGVVDEGGDSFGDITTDGIMVLDLDGERWEGQLSLPR